MFNALKYLTKIVLLTIVYAIGAKIGLALAFEQANTSPVWPPTGLSIAALLCCGVRVWPGVLIGAMVANYSAGVAGLPMLSIGIGNTLEALAGYYAIRATCREPFFNHVGNVVRFVVIAFTVSTISATIGVGSLLAYQVIASDAFWLLWSTWWFGDSIGALVFTPLLYVWVRSVKALPSPRQLREMAVAATITLLCGVLIFSNWVLTVTEIYPLSFLYLPVAIWTTSRFRQHGATAITLAILIFCIIGTLNGVGPFVTASINNSLLLLQGFIAVVAVTTLTLGASLEERRQHQRDMHAINANLQTHVEQRTAELSEQVTNRDQINEALRGLLNISTTGGAEAFYQTCARQLARIYGCRFAMVGVFADNDRKAIRTLAFWRDGEWLDNITYALAGTPCQDVLNSAVEFIPSGVQQAYPEDHYLIELNIESYFAAPLQTPSGLTVGIVVLLHDKPLQLQDWSKPVLRIFADRIAIEYQREQAEAELRLAASVFKDTDEAIIITDRNRRIIRVNPAFERITGYAGEEVMGSTPKILRSGYHDDGFYQELWLAMDNDGVWRGEIWDRRKNEQAFPTWQTLSTVKDQNGDIIRYISIFSDISEKKSIEENMYHLAHFDVLTGLHNRASFVDSIQQAISHASRLGHQMALLFMDIDNFKYINDASGHAVGDHLLKHVANRVKTLVRDEDIVARLGGDEFTILLRDIKSGQDAAIVAEKILLDIKEPIDIDGAEIVVTSSIGISIYPQDGADSNTLMKSADVAMYRAKTQGRNAFQFFTSEMHKQALQRLSLENDLRRAIGTDEFLLHFQPQVSATSGKMIACEALLRWEHPRKGRVAPDVFIPVAEESGLIVPLGEWVIIEACRQHRRWVDAGLPPIRITVNLSGRQLIRQHLLHTVKAAIDSNGVAPQYLEIELTESSMMSHINENIETFSKLRALGVQLSIDDFGTGYSSMAYLKRFPINRLKIDQSFVRDITTSADDAAIVSATIVMAHALNLAVVAEGVETQQQFDFLRLKGCEEMQGYYFSKPLPAAEFADLLRHGNQLDFLPLHAQTNRQQ